MGSVQSLCNVFRSSNERHQKKVIVQEEAYADDVDFLNKDGIELDLVEKTLASWNLQMNKEKTELYQLMEKMVNGRKANTLECFLTLKKNENKGKI